MTETESSQPLALRAYKKSRIAWNPKSCRAKAFQAAPAPFRTEPVQLEPSRLRAEPAETVRQQNPDRSRQFDSALLVNEGSVRKLVPAKKYRIWQRTAEAPSRGESGSKQIHRHNNPTCVMCDILLSACHCSPHHKTADCGHVR